MERAAPAADHLKEVAWGAFMIDLALALVALLYLPHFGTRGTLPIFGTFAPSVTLLLGGVAVLNVLRVWLYERWERLRAALACPEDSLIARHL